MKKLFLLSLAVMALFATSLWAEDVTWEGPYGNFVSKKLSDNTTTVTVTKDGSNSSKTISCIKNSSQSYQSINGDAKYLKFSVPDGYTITNIKMVWMSGAANQVVPILFGESISAIGTVESKDKAVTITNGGFKTTNQIATSGATNCDSEDDIAIPGGAKQLLIGRNGSYKASEYTIGNVESTVKFRLASSGGYFTTDVGATSTVYIGRITLTVSPDCDAETPGTISKGTFNEGYLTLNVDREPSANNVWYWQTSASGTSTETAFDAENPRTVNAAGTYYLRSYYNNSCWGSASSIAISASDLVENYTVVYKDGETTLGSETIEVGQKPTASGISTTKDFYTFAAWQLGGVDKALTDDSWALVEANATVTLTARWTAPLYTSGTYVFENNATVGTNPSKTVTTTKTTYPAFHIDNIYFDEMDIQYEGGVYPGQGDDFNGWKIKSEAKTIRFLVENNSQVTAQMGNLTSGCNITYTPITGAATTEVLAEKTANKYNVKAGTIVTLTTQGSNTVTLKQIAVATLYDVTLDKGSNASTTGAAIVTVDATALTITTATTGTGTLVGFYTAASEGTKVANADGTFVNETVDGYITAGKWSHAGIATLYAVYDSASGINDVENEAKAVKRVVNGQLFIEKNGKTYNAQGIEIR